MIAVSSCGGSPSAPSPPPAEVISSWLQGSGNDLHNTRWQPSETMIGTTNVASLAAKWVATVAGDVSATPTTDGTNVYFPDWGGYLNALSSATGAVIWQKAISSYTGVTSLSRTSPAIVDDGKALIIGDIAAIDEAPGPGASILKIDTKTGELIWATTVETHPEAIITANPTVLQNTIIVGVASSEEVAALNGGYPCCTFRGSVVALDEITGAILWKTYMVPDNGGAVGGYSGGSVWGSSPMVDTVRGLVYVGTGNNYTVPGSVSACQLLLPNSPTCIDPNDQIDAVVSLDLLTGAVRWTFQSQFSDNSTDGCITGVNCELPVGPDHDFAQAPIFVDNPNHAVVFAGRKSGTGYGLNADTGSLLWSTSIGESTQWGSASDGQRIYVASVRSPAGWSALDPGTGKILWTTNDPGGLGNSAHDIGPLTVANGVLYAGSTNTNGPTMFGLDTSNGSILLSFQSGSSVAGGAAVANGTVYWGSGYSRISVFTGNKKIFALTPNGK
jgi:polyvinyl alcohol dehydrogenase (cytochrome)